jgi:hypothetical protein
MSTGMATIFPLKTFRSSNFHSLLNSFVSVFGVWSRRTADRVFSVLQIGGQSSSVLHFPCLSQIYIHCVSVANHAAEFMGLYSKAFIFWMYCLKVTHTLKDKISLSTEKYSGGLWSYFICSSFNNTATNRKVAGSSPDELDFFNWPNPSSHPGVDSASNRNE